VWMKKIKWLFFILLILSGGVSLSGSSIMKSKPPDGYVLNVAFGMDMTEWKVFEEIIFPAFKEETGITIKAIDLKQKDLVRELEIQVKSNDLILDMFAQDVNDLYDLVAKGFVEDLSDHKEIVPETVIPGMTKAVHFDGKMLFFPYRPNVEIVFYNKNKFEEVGLRVPENWNELLLVAKEFKKTGVGAIGIKANLKSDTILQMFEFIKSAGGDPYILNDEGSITAFQFLQKLYPYVSQYSLTADWNTMNNYLEQDIVYLGRNWPFYIPQFNKNGKTEIRAYSGWTGPVKESHILGGEVIGITKGSKKKDDAIRFAEYLMSQPVQELLASQLAWPPVRSDAYRLVDGYQKPYFEAIRKALEHAEPRGNVPYWPEAEKIYLEAFKKAVIENGDVVQTLNDAAAKLEKLRVEERN
jgi:trehalose transport system substrate-binding protein